MKKYGVYFLIFILLFTINPIPPMSVSAEESDDEELDGEEVVLLAEQVDEEILLFESIEDIEENKEAEKIPDDTSAILLHNTTTEEVNDIEYTFIRYEKENEDDEEGQNLVEGYVESEAVVPLELEEQFKADRLKEQEEATDSDDVSEDDENATSEDDGEESEEIESDDEDATSDKEDTVTDDGESAEKDMDPEEESDSEEASEEEDKDESDEESTDETEIDEKDEDEAEEEVEIESKEQDKPRNHSEISLAANQTSYNGIALKNKTHVYSKQSRDSKSLKSYSKGSILKYSSLNKNWYVTGVFINGKKQTGYIHKSDVENADDKSKSLQGVASKSPTRIYASASTNSKSIKSYKAGSILKYSTFSKDWYRTGVFINGKKQTGYIHKSHVENATDKPKSSFGVALSKNTNIYAKASKDSKALKSYKQGTILKYSTFSKNWYKTGVFINGKKHTGYIHKSDVGTPKKQSQLEGIALKKTIQVYQEPFNSSKTIKTYKQGHILKYRPYSNNWYITGVFIDGKKQTVFIKASDVDTIKSNSTSLKGLGVKSPTHVYASPTRNGKTLKSYNKGSTLKFSTFTKDWYKTGVYINGKKHTGYIHRSDVDTSSKKVVYLDAGHGGSDPGASGNSLKEKTLTLDIAKRAKKLLESKGYIVIMSRTSDKYVSLSERTNEANKANADIFVSIHINSGGGTGIETYKMDNGPKPKESDILAQQLQNELIKQTKANNRGVKDKNLHVNRESKMPSSLVELGFIDNKTDAEKLKSSSFKKKLANGIVNGISSYFKLVH